MEFLQPYAGWGTRALELAIGVVFILHDWEKVQNPTAVGRIFGKSKSVGILFGLVEVLAGAMIATGMGTFYGALVVIVITLGAIYHKIFKWKTPLTTTGATGWEFDLVLLAGALTLLLG